MKVSDLVKLKGDPHEVLGVIVEIAPDILTRKDIYYVCWVCDMCDDSWFNPWDLEAVCK